jgi:signal transduction histidine kinase
VLIPANKESLEIDFSILSLSAPNHCRFEYQLENYEPTWTAGEGASGAIRYRKLPPGEYQFRVRGCNEDGVWNSTAAILPVKVSPPFWRTWWFIALSTILTLVAVIGSVHFASTQKLQRQLAVLRQKEALEKERSRISRDLHDQLGANLTQVALLGEMVEADKALPDEVETHARQISQTARETTRSLDEIVWDREPFERHPGWIGELPL